MKNAGQGSWSLSQYPEPSRYVATLLPTTLLLLLLYCWWKLELVYCLIPKKNI